MTPLRGVAGGLVAVALCGCGEAAFPQKPHLRIEAELANGTLQFGSVYVGATAVRTLTLFNDGLQTLSLSGAAISGDGEFTLDGPTQPEITSRDRAFLAVLFAPAESRDFSASITVSSNSERGAQEIVPVAGRGVQ